MFNALVTVISIVDYMIHQYGSSKDFNKIVGGTNFIVWQMKDTSGTSTCWQSLDQNALGTVYGAT